MKLPFAICIHSHTRNYQVVLRNVREIMGRSKHRKSVQFPNKTPDGSTVVQVYRGQRFVVWNSVKYIDKYIIMNAVSVYLRNMSNRSETVKVTAYWYFVVLVYSTEPHINYTYT